MQSTPEASDVSERLRRAEFTLATAESMTGGAVAEALVDVEGASKWLAGGVIAYMSRVKYDLLGVREGPVVCEDAAREMAISVADLLATDVGVSTTGVAGPEPMEDQPVGTLFVGVAVRGNVTARRYQLDGNPEEIRAGAVRAALALAAEALSELPARS